MNDARTSLAPLSPELTSHLLETLGQPESTVVTRDGDRDVSLRAWVVGLGETRARLSPSVERGTTVTIRLTASGYLMTTRCAWTRAADGGGSDSQTGQVHTTPELAYQWLVNDGKGKLGPASKQAWVQACRSVPAMSGLEYEQVDSCPECGKPFEVVDSTARTGSAPVGSTRSDNPGWRTGVQFRCAEHGDYHRLEGQGTRKG